MNKNNKSIHGVVIVDRRKNVKGSFFLLRYILIILCFPLSYLFAQDTGNMILQNTEVKDTAQQKDLIDIVTHQLHLHLKTTRMMDGKRIYFSLLPISANVPGGGGRALITSTSAATYFGPRSTTNISSATFAPYWNFNGRFGLPLRTSVWLPNNTWTIQGDTRVLYYPQYTWGLGSSHSTDDRTLVDYKYIRFYQSVLKRITPYSFAGVGYHLDYHFNIKSDNPNVDLKQYTGYSYGTGHNSFSSGISLNFLYDTRNNSINPRPGSYANIVYRINPTFLGSNNTWHSLYVDVRKYISLSPAKYNQQNTLAFWSYFWTVLNSKSPYLDLPGIGWDPYDRSGRGIDQNRYRGKSIFYMESEYRRDITHNGLFGFVLFANLNTVSGSGTLFTSWHPAAGTGLRIKFNKGSNTNIGIDYGFSKGYSAIIFNLGETF